MTKDLFNRAEFVERLRARRIARGITQEELAITIGCPKRTYATYESLQEGATAKPDLLKFERIVSALKTSPGHLLQGVGPTYIDLEGAEFLQEVLGKVIDAEDPFFGMLVKRTIKMNRKQLTLMVHIAEGLDEEF